MKIEPVANPLANGLKPVPEQLDLSGLKDFISQDSQRAERDRLIREQKAEQEARRQQIVSEEREIDRIEKEKRDAEAKAKRFEAIEKIKEKS
jgi:hypothetical protein